MHESNFRWPVASAALALPQSANAADAGVAASALPAAIVVTLALAGAVAAIWQWLRARRRLAALAAEARTIAGEADPTRDAPVGADDAATVLLALRSIRASTRRLASGHQEEFRRRGEAERHLRETEERYALAVRGANDGMWEWDIPGDCVHYSPRWKGMLGYEEREIGTGLNEWLDRIHPDDADRVTAALEAHLEGSSPRFELEYRLRQRDGSHRWVLARACAIRHASGRPYRLIGLNTDITARHQAQDTLIQLADALSGLRGEEFFRALVRSLVSVLHAREAFVAECVDYPTTRVRMLAHWNHNDFAGCPAFDLSGTSCERVIREGRQLYVPKNLGEQFPLERAYDREAYLGLPCFDSEGRVIGHIACANGQPMPEELPHYAILKLFAVRAALELERRQVLHLPDSASEVLTLH